MILKLQQIAVLLVILILAACSNDSASPVDSGTESENSGTDSGVDSNLDSDTHTGVVSGTDSTPSSDADGDTQSDSTMDTGQTGDSESNTSSETGTDADSDSETATEADSEEKDGCNLSAAAGTFIDTEHCLMWELDSLAARLPNETGRTRADAISFCESLTTAGFSDWRLPTVSEARTLIVHHDYNNYEEMLACTDGGQSCCGVSDACVFPVCVGESCMMESSWEGCDWNEDVFGTDCVNTWTDTTIPVSDDYLTGGNPGYYFAVNFEDGSIWARNPATDSYYAAVDGSMDVLCVRGNGLAVAEEDAVNGTEVPGATTACSATQSIMAQGQSVLLSCVGLYCADGLFCSSDNEPLAADLQVAYCITNAAIATGNCESVINTCGLLNMDAAELVWYGDSGDSLVCVSPEDMPNSGSSGDGCTTDAQCGPCSRCTDHVCRYCGYGPAGLCTC